MGKNKIRNRDRQRKENTSSRDNSDSNILSTWTSTIENVETRSTSSMTDRRHLLAEPFRRKLNMPATASLKTSQTSTTTSPAPMSRTKGAQEKRDSVISSTWEGPKRHSQPKTTSVKQPWWGFEPGAWWPCRALRWTYHFFRALIRIHWTDQQTLQDLALTLVLIGLTIAGFYVVLGFLLRALPGVAAQGLDGNCSIVYVTVPGPIITVSLIGASPTNPARGTYYFSVINGTTEWLNSIAPPSRFSTLVTRTVDVTPVISSLPTTGTSSSGAVTAPSTQTPTTSALSLFSPSAPGPGATFTSSLTSGVTFESSASTGVSGSTPPTSSLALSSVSLSPLGPASSETSSLPRPIDQPQRPYPSYPLSTTVVITSNEFYSTVTTLYTLVSSSNFSTGSSSSFPPVIPSSSLPGLSPNLPSSTSGGMPSQPTSEPSPPLSSSVSTTLTSGPSTGLASFTTSATTSLSSSVLSAASTSSSSLDLLSPSASLASSTGSSSVALSSSLPSWLTTNSSITSGSSGPASPSPTLTSSANSISTILPTSSTLSLSVSSRSALNSAFTSSSASPLDSFSTPLTSILVSSTSTGSFTQFPGTNYSSSTSRNPTSPSSALLVSNTITNSTPSSSFLRGSSTSTDGIMSIQTDTVASASHPSSGIVSPSTTTSTLTLTTTTSLVVSSPSPSALNATSLSSFRAVTKVISYGDAAVTFVFPSPDITTTMSYWTGLYPTVTGPLPSDLQTIPLTTRTERQTPLSALPSFEIFSSRSRRFKTVFEDEGTTALARRQVIPITEVLPTQALGTTMLATTTVALPDLPGPSSCGESGNFTLTFDDTVVGDDDSMLVVANGMTNPYHHLFYANGYTYVPDMWEPYPAISQPNIAMFLPLTGRLLPNTPFAGMMLPGELGAGPRASVNAYWFNAYSAYFGCALSGLEPCTLRVSGYRYDPVRKEEVLVAEQNATIPACWGYIDCHLTQVFFNDQFRALSGIQFNAYTYLLGIPQVHMVDDLQMEWYNNTCSAGILRIGHS